MAYLGAEHNTPQGLQKTLNECQCVGVCCAKLTAPWTSAVNGCTETFQTGTVDCEQGKFERTKREWWLFYFTVMEEPGELKAAPLTWLNVGEG